MFNIVFVCGLLFTLISESSAYVKANSFTHQCVNIQDCPQLYGLLTDRSQRDKADALIKQSICGSNGHIPKVWCLKQQCRTPDGLSGTCIPLGTCTTVYNIVNNSTLVEIVTKQYLQGLRCPNTDQHSSSTSRENFSICCPSDEKEFQARLFPTANLLPDPDKNQCGFNANNKITGGKQAELDDFPWTALLHFTSTQSNNVVRCAGSLINERYIITAAHCVEDSVVRRNGKLDRVTLGEYNIQTSRDCIGNTCAEPVVVAYVESVTIHPDWYTQPRSLINNDIALIRLTKPVRTSAYVAPICLPQANSDIPDNLQLEITGWGFTEKDVISDVKRKAIVRSSNKNSCKQFYRDYLQLNVGDGIFCATGKDGADSCAGDSGGPIMLRKANADGLRISFLAGLVSFGSTNCGAEDTPALYTQTSKYINWIKKSIRP